MKISWLKLKQDNNSFRIFKNIGLDVYDLEEPEDTDKKIQELVNKQYRTIVISNELAGFSEDIIKKYKKAQNINIIITYNFITMHNKKEIICYQKKNYTINL